MVYLVFIFVLLKKLDFCNYLYLRCFNRLDPQGGGCFSSQARKGERALKNIEEHVIISRTDLKMGNYEAEQIHFVKTDKPSKAEDLYLALAELVIVIIESLKNMGE